MWLLFVSCEGGNKQILFVLSMTECWAVLHDRSSCIRLEYDGTFLNGVSRLELGIAGNKMAMVSFVD